MSGLNLCVIVGRVGQDPESRYTQAGECVVNLSLATSEQWKDKQTGEKREETQWHRAVLWSRTAEVAAEYLRKGDWATVRGRLQTRKWTDKEGIERYTTEIRVDDLTLMGGPGGGRREDANSAPRDSAGAGADPMQQASDYARESAGGTRSRAPVAAGADPEDDIPF